MTPRGAEEFWLDLAIRHTLLLLRLQEGEARRVEALLREVFDELAAETALRSRGRFKRRGPSGSTEGSRALRDLLEKGDAKIAAAYSKALDLVKEALQDAAAYEAAWSARTLDRVMPADFGIQAVSGQALRAIVNSRPFQGALLREWWSRQEESTKVAYRTAVRHGLVLGESNLAIAERVGTALGKHVSQVMGITRTAVRHVTERASLETFLANSHVIARLVWVSTLDAKTTPICISLSGKTFPLDSGPRPPAHFNCRSKMAPVLKPPDGFGLRDPGIRLERAARDYNLDPSSLPREPRARRRAIMRAAFPTRVDRGLTYSDWLRRQPKVVQNEVLGKVRAELWRSGKVEITRFVGRDLRVLTLRELARREGLPLEEILKLAR